MHETPTSQPELPSSPEQLAIAQLSETVREALDARGVSPQPIEGGGEMRELVTDPVTSGTLREVVAADGSTSYSESTLFSQRHDRGQMTWTWAADGNAITYEGDLEVAGHEVETIGDEAGISLVQSNVNYQLSKLRKPESATGGRGRRFLSKLGHLATGRR